MTTRATILARAFGRLGIADYEYSVSPEERADARLTLDAMMAEWTATGYDLGYVPSDGTDNDAVAMTTPAWADAPIWNNLALRMAADYGKIAGSGLTRDAKRGYDLIVSTLLTVPPSRNASSVIQGAGQRYYRWYPY